MRDLLEAGVHFGHQTRRWNPKMKRFIFTERGGIYIIDLTQTSELLEEAYDFVRNLAERGGTILFVGTKKQAQDSVAQEAARVGMPYVANRWLGGLLTNWRTITDRIAHLHELRRLKSEGQLELLPAKERITLLAELEKLEVESRWRRRPAAAARRRLHRRSPEGAARRARGAPARRADHRAGRHELRPGRGRLHHSRQRRRDPLVQPDRASDRRRHRRRQGQGDREGARRREHERQRERCARREPPADEPAAEEPAETETPAAEQPAEEPTAEAVVEEPAPEATPQEEPELTVPDAIEIPAAEKEEETA